MKIYKFSLNVIEVESMWNFAKMHEVVFHFVRSIDLSDKNRRYIYEGFMTPDTYLIFKLMVPAREHK